MTTTSALGKIFALLRNPASHLGPTAITLAALLFLGACAAPVGPRYLVEREQLDIEYVASSPPRLHIRATYHLKNIGSHELKSVDASLPDEKSSGRRNTHVSLDGRELTFQSLRDSDARTVRLPFDPPWSEKQRRVLIVEYDLATPLPGHAAIAVNDNSFHIRDQTAFPELRAPNIFFAKGGEAPAEIELNVFAPPDFRVFAAGREQKPKRRRDTSGHMAQGHAERTYRIGRKDFHSFVVGGRYQEQRIPAAGSAIVFWTFVPVPPEQVKTAAARLAQTLDTYKKAFGPLVAGVPPMHLVETPAQLTGQSNGPESAAGVDLPEVALLNRAAFALGISSDGFLDLADRELAHTWFGQLITPRPEAELVLGSGVSHYAALLAGEAHGGETERQNRIALLLRRYDEAGGQAEEKPLLVPANDLSIQQRAVGTYKSALFFVALEDQYGKDSVRHALAHLVSSLRGREVADEELRSALEIEVKQDLFPFFRLWLNLKGIPPDFRARYQRNAVNRK